MKELAIIIPVYNEEENVEKVLKDWKNILEKKKFDIIVINDGSTDKTKSILNKVRFKNSHIKVLNKKNSGHGETVFLGYKYAVKKKYRFIFQVDSDDQFSSSDFKRLWKFKDKSYDLIMGNRLRRKDPIVRIFLSKIVLRLFFLVYFNKNITDANIPYRLIGYNFLNNFVKKSSKKYIAPNILMTLYAENILSLSVKHFQRSKGVIKWPLKKLFNFGLILILEILEWKKIISK
jgi:glycosyltransferase involved in cell wall biosynthesis|tara:strand:+ start:2141 stop:2839 length:699 start_codon:yes stop_codon:yes gene_type:complete